jgi:hypothetical protein
MGRKVHGNGPKTATTALELDGCTQALPKGPLAWLRQYGITDEEIHQNQLCWNPERQHLVFPIRESNAAGIAGGRGVLPGDRVVATCSRSFGPGPKYLTQGNTKHYKVFPRANNIYVLVEDFVSAIKVGRHYNCIPLLGAHVSLDLILSLVFRKPRLRIWLDPDKRIEAMKYTARALQYIPDCATIVADKDPKDYGNEELKSIVSSTLEGVSERRDVQ